MRHIFLFSIDVFCVLRIGMAALIRIYIYIYMLTQIFTAGYTIV